MVHFIPHMLAASILPEDLDDQPQCLLKIVGYIDDHRKHSGRHDRCVDETFGHVETPDGIAIMVSVVGSGGSVAAPADTVPWEAWKKNHNASNSDDFIIGKVTSVVPLESLLVSCWIQSGSSDLTIIKLMHRRQLSSVLRSLLHDDDSKLAVRGVALGSSGSEWI